MCGQKKTPDARPVQSASLKVGSDSDGKDTSFVVTKFSDGSMHGEMPPSNPENSFGKLPNNG